MDMDDDEYDDLWDYLSESMSRREYRRLEAMDWDDFIAFLTDFLNEDY